MIEIAETTEIETEIVIAADVVEAAVKAELIYLHDDEKTKNARHNQ